jgi:hypothetical protein
MEPGPRSSLYRRRSRLIPLSQTGSSSSATCTFCSSFMRAEQVSGAQVSSQFSKCPMDPMSALSKNPMAIRVAQETALPDTLWPAEPGAGRTPQTLSR